MMYAIVASLVLAVASTLGDFVWAAGNVRHRALYGLVHGAAICLCIGALIGARTGRLSIGIAVGPLVGLIAAAAFYALAPSLGYSAMFPAWMLFWILFALLQARLVRTPVGSALARGLIAAALSGIAFYLVSGMWTRPSPGGPDYAANFVRWAFAFLPGFLALFIGPRKDTERPVDMVHRR
jgi:hypothetical protein